MSKEVKENKAIQKLHNADKVLKQYESALRKIAKYKGTVEAHERKIITLTSELSDTKNKVTELTNRLNHCNSSLDSIAETKATMTKDNMKLRIKLRKALEFIRVFMVLDKDEKTL